MTPLRAQRLLPKGADLRKAAWTAEVRRGRRVVVVREADRVLVSASVGRK